jgi:ferric-dicitrate binding protein FerR (iron transport regulator)
MRLDEAARLQAAVESMRSEPDEAGLTAAAGRVAERLGLGLAEGEAGMEAIRSFEIQNCDDVQALLADYGAGRLPEAQAMLIEAHLRECGACLRLSRAEAGRGGAVLDWARPETKRAARSAALRPRRLGWASGMGLAACLALGVGFFFGYRSWWEVPLGVRAQVESIDGTAYRISDGGDRALAPGDSLSEGDRLRTGGGSHAVLRLSDGSTVEVNERSVLGVGARGHNMTVALDNGAVIVQAAKRTSGHLYVKTPDCRVAVTGTIFSVNSGIKGSRVAVLQGTVDVAHEGVDTLVTAGDQMTTNDNLSEAPVTEQIAWSHDRDKYLPLLAELSQLQRKIEAIPFPQPRYTSDLLTRMPEDALLYISIPNLGDFLSQANKIFDDQLQQSPVLQQWWSSGNGHNTAELDALVDKVHQGSQYLGEEVVVVGMKQGDSPTFAVVADLRKSGFADFLKAQLPAGNGGLVLLDEASLKTVSMQPAEPKGKPRMAAYGLIREHEVVFSNSVATLRTMDAKLNSGASGFASGDFGKQITAAYGRGAGVILAADVHSMVADRLAQMHDVKDAGKPNMLKGAAEKSGLEGVQYLIAEHREVNGKPENHLNVQFAGERERVASWLGAPAPMGSLEFVTPNASVAVAVLTKDPKAIADDILSMTAMKNAEGDPGTAESRGDWKGADDKKTQMITAFRDEIVGNLGGEFLMAMDGPVLPNPAWKAVIEVKDANGLEQTMESLSKMVREQEHGKYTMGFEIVASQEGDQHYYAVRNLATGMTVAQYTFSGGYMIVAGDRAVLTQALHAHTSGDSLARSGSFKALLPKDENDNYSAIAYQNLSPVVGPLLSQFSGQEADAIRQLAADARPTAICAWGKENRIEAASDSHLLGFDFLALGSLMHPGTETGNKVPAANVTD